MRRSSCRGGVWTPLILSIFLGIVSWSCSGTGDKSRDAGVPDGVVADVGSDPWADVLGERDLLAATDADGDVCPEELPGEDPGEPPCDAGDEVVADAGAEGVSDAKEDVPMLVGCDPEPEAGSLWALFAPDRETAEQVPMCTWRGDVVLIVNTAAS